MAQANGSRVDLVDGLRGYALFGLFLVHLMERFELYWLDPRPDAVLDWVFFIFAGKSFALFALCFGFSFATIMANAERRGQKGAGRFAWRLVLLFAIGTLHALWYRGDILQVLAVMGLLLIPARAIRRPRWLIALGLVCIANPLLIARALAAGAGTGWAQQPPVFTGDTGLSILANGSLIDLVAVNAGPGMAGKWSFYLDTGRLLQIAGLFLFGMAMARSGLLAAPERFVRERRAILIAAFAVATPLYFLSNALLPPAADAGGQPMHRDHWNWALASWQATAWMLVQAMLFIALWRSPIGALLRPLAAPGRMTLSFYIGQSLLFVPLFYGFGLRLFDAGSHGLWLLVGLLAFSVQILIARWWLARFRYGPLEWLWRMATRMERVPIART
ncbi:DUF418 domain-containing protein [Sphingomonas sp. BGYR3]|uniref:DUF418 domain-containing protein n=1 Tax=Sphingomonas sp. BGYR3 TaxID=2975483 RepID=UPI0021A610F3|nr:DUF418 domain-containing protein [Sphingomonas sp. BGYR3]